MFSVFSVSQFMYSVPYVSSLMFWFPCVFLVFPFLLFSLCSVLCIFPFLLSCLSPPVCQYTSCLILCVISSSSQMCSSLLSPHLFLVSSLVSVYLVPACPCLFVRSLLLYGVSVVFNVSFEFLPLSSLFFLFPSGICFLGGFWILVPKFWFVLCLFVGTLVFCYFVSFWSLDSFSFVLLVFVDFGFCLIKLAFCFPLILPPVCICIWVHPLVHL